jgi:hypothetical protein
MHPAVPSLNSRRRTLLLGVLALSAATPTLAKKPQVAAVPIQVWKDGWAQVFNSYS